MPINEAHLITIDINIKHPIIGVNDLINNTTGKTIEQRLEEENFIILNNHEATHKDGGTLDMNLADSKLASLFDKLYAFNESHSNHYKTLSI